MVFVINKYVNRYYVYYLVDPRNNQPFYVGKGSRGRINAHETEARKPINKQWNPAKCKIINEIKNEGLLLIKEIIQDRLSEQQAYILEDQLIKKHGKVATGGILVNIVDGGSGGKRKGHNKPIDQYSLTGEFVATFNSTHDAAHVLHIQPSQINGVLKGRTRQAGGFLWTYHNDIPAHYSRCRPVYQLDTRGNILHMWNSVKECCSHLGLQQSSVRECISGKHNTSGGFVWRYAV